MIWRCLAAVCIRIIYITVRYEILMGCEYEITTVWGCGALSCGKSLRTSLKIVAKLVPDYTKSHRRRSYCSSDVMILFPCADGLEFNMIHNFRVHLYVCSKFIRFGSKFLHYVILDRNAMITAKVGNAFLMKRWNMALNNEVNKELNEY
jgi:hypothetical protein